MPGARTTKVRQELSRKAADGDSRSRIRIRAIDVHGRSHLRDIADWGLVARDEQAIGAAQIVPLGIVSFVSIKDLDAVILTIRDINLTISVATNVVWQVELPRIAAGFAPGKQQFTIWRVFVNPCVAIAIGHIDIAIGRQSRIGFHTIPERCAPENNAHDKAPIKHCFAEHSA
jgi:hypothetical protein